ncbi:hypothetical protein Bhyg_16445 [Pseudolycoriella hygida]|uniref:Uncharacterized protein n=1 Tax=Pseudolycoriella hygida TaxID=35572 RepID=A0A9Q0MK89_9DIPT|nr:hypothetical protein Bhyg_16445 [Pseudolycoriella hygida]
MGGFATVGNFFHFYF